MENKFNSPDLKQEALDYFDSITENVFSLPEFPPPKKDILSSFTFKNFCHHFHQHKHKKTKHIPKILLVVAKLFGKNHKHWFKSDLRHLFRWHDVHVSHIIHKNTKDHCHAIAQFMHDLCGFIHKNTSGVIEDHTLESFLSHPIYDYSRPYDWHLRQDYVSYSQALMAIYCEKVGKGFPSTLENKFVSQSNSSIKSRFHKLFPEEFPEHLDQKTIKIPYSLYEKCWHSAQSDATIQPYDIEICFYFTQQNNLGLNYVVDDFWDGKSGDNKHEHKMVLHVIPLMKFFSLYDWRRLQIMNAIISGQEDSDLIQRWKHKAAKTYIYHQLPDIHGLGGLAVCRANIFLSHQGALNNFYRIDKGHSLIYPLVQTSLLNQHLTQSFLEWLCQKSDQSYDLRYLNILPPALETLKRNGQFVVDSREKIQKHPKASHLMKVLFKEFPLVGVLSVLLKNDPSRAHKVPDLTSVLDKQKSKDHHLHLKIHSLTPQQKSALSVKKYIPTSIDPIITDLIKSVRKDKDLHDSIAPHDLFYRNHRVEIKLKALSAHLLPKQGLSSLQRSQDPKMSMKAIHDLNALSLVKSSVFSLHSATAARVIAHLPAEDLRVSEDPSLDLWGIDDLAGSIKLAMQRNGQKNAVVAARGLVQNTTGADLPLPNINPNPNPIEEAPPQGSTLVRMMDDYKANNPQGYAPQKPTGRPAGVGAKQAPSAGLFDDDDDINQPENDFSGDDDDILSLPEIGDEAEPLPLPETATETETFLA